MRPLRADDPRVVGGYQLLGVLGGGGMGRVYLARGHGGRTVAVKVIRPEYADDPSFRVRFRREVDAARRVGGPWTAPLLDADPDAEHPYLVTAYIPGPSLTQAVAEHGPLPAPTVRALGAGLAEALIAIHGAGLVHRDLKPSNVLLSLDGPRVIDFGISRAVDASVLTRTGSPIGSPAFMSPEQVGGLDAGPASDVFSLGSVLVFAATGTGPFDGSIVAAVLHSVVTREPNLAAMPPDLRDLARACLNKNPAARPTPPAVLAALAPGGGAAALVAAGWLPADLITGLGRQAIALLDLDAPAWSHTGPPTGQDPGSTPGSRSSHDHSWGSGTGTASAPRPQAVSIPPAATAPPAGDSRQRRLIVAAAAGFLSLVVAALLVVLLVLPGWSGDEGPEGLETTSPSGSPDVSSGPERSVSNSPDGSSQPSQTGAPRSGALPANYVGTWEGRVTSGEGVVSNVVITLRAGENGQTLGHAESTLVQALGMDVEPLTCTGELRFDGIGGPRGDEVIVVDIPGSGENPVIMGIHACTQGDVVRLHLETDGGLTYASDSSAAGRPTGVLRRTP
ncbi:serine/threonine-protein kinase [Pseudofrankia asymbiotica]|uniref:Serine/threonine protein kinase n=1 Tax=Pseudofrankia asymbiotica TaxID=1834516 RepID=A0A1V2ICL8_9ACTN|nr:serine/threonine-protein kinase [Pseudofrankia asymbiotica]ONH30629.1 serine/threonine protein kinase [Pseudofrankia asymbiotica]